MRSRFKPRRLRSMTYEREPSHGDPNNRFPRLSAHRPVTQRSGTLGAAWSAVPNASFDQSTSRGIPAREINIRNLVKTVKQAAKRITKLALRALTPEELSQEVSDWIQNRWGMLYDYGRPFASPAFVRGVLQIGDRAPTVAVINLDIAHEPSPLQSALVTPSEGDKK